MEFCYSAATRFKLKQLARTPLALSCAAHRQWSFVDSAATRHKLKELALTAYPQLRSPLANGNFVEFCRYTTLE